MLTSAFKGARDNPVMLRSHLHVKIPSRELVRARETLSLFCPKKRFAWLFRGRFTWRCDRGFTPRRPHNSHVTPAIAPYTP